LGWFSEYIDLPRVINDAREDHLVTIEVLEKDPWFKVEQYFRKLDCPESHARVECEIDDESQIGVA
jgi:hypothetical protein